MNGSTPDAKKRLTAQTVDEVEVGVGDNELGRVAQLAERRGCRQFEGTPSQAVSEVAGSSPAPAHISTTTVVDEVESLAKLLYEDCYTTPWRDAPDLYRDIWLDKAAKVIASDWLAQREATLRSTIAAEIEERADGYRTDADDDRLNGHGSLLTAYADAARIVRNGGTK